MQTNNPILTRSSVTTSQNPMTIQGAVRKSMGLLAVCSAVALGIFLFAKPAAGMATMIGLVGSLILGLLLAFKQDMAKTLALPFAVAQGLFMGGVSVAYGMRYDGLPLTAVAATLVTAFTMLGLYRSGVIRATQKFKAVVMSATLALFVLFIVQMVMQLAFKSSIPLLFGNGLIGTGFAAFVAVLASLNLILDFDAIERGAEMGAPESFEWVAGTAVMATLVWMYISFLRLFAVMQSSD